MKKVQEEIGMLQGIAVSSVGKSGGLALLWKPDMNVSIRFLNRWYMILGVRLECGDSQVFMETQKHIGELSLRN